MNGANLASVEQASRLLFSLQAGSRDGCPTSQIPLKLAPFMSAITGTGLLARRMPGAERPCIRRDGSVDGIVRIIFVS